MEPVLLRRGVELAPQDAAAGARELRLGVDMDRLQPGKIDEDPVVAGAQAGHAVTASAHGHGEGLVAPEVDRGDHIGGARAAGDDRGSPVDHAVEDLARLVVTSIGRRDHLARETFTQCRCRLVAPHRASYVELARLPGSQPRCQSDRTGLRYLLGINWPDQRPNVLAARASGQRSCGGAKYAEVAAHAVAADDDSGPGLAARRVGERDLRAQMAGCGRGVDVDARAG